MPFLSHCCGQAMLRCPPTARQSSLLFLPLLLQISKPEKEAASTPWFYAPSTLRPGRFLNRVHKFDSCRGHSPSSQESPATEQPSAIRRDTPIYARFRRSQGRNKGNTRFAVVIPTGAEAAARRVPRRVRDLLRIDVYAVSDDGQVEKLAD
jgi:hypothetical protein